MNGKTPHIVQYQGSKRILARQILQFMPRRFDRLIEPFAGMAAISIAVANEHRTSRFHINDLNVPLVGILREAIEHPEQLVEKYSRIWQEQFEFERNHIDHYYHIRDRFNEGEQTPENMLYLLARCVKGSVRYGRNGGFNQSPDKRRHGTSPATLAFNVEGVSRLLKGKCTFSSWDYRKIFEMAEPGDLIYMDPPYQGVSNTKDNRYFASISFDDFVESIAFLNERGIDYLISYDGACGGKTYGKRLPAFLGCKKALLNAGLSSQALLLGRKATTLEALYVSENLIPCLRSRLKQLDLFEAS